MQVTSMIDAQSALDAPRTPPRGGSHLDEDQSDQEENDSDDESGDEDDGPAKKKVSRGRRAWTELGTWDRTAMLDSEIAMSEWRSLVLLSGHRQGVEMKIITSDYGCATENISEMEAG